jgi:hypothetical protein
VDAGVQIRRDVPAHTYCARHNELFSFSFPTVYAMAYPARGGVGQAYLYLPRVTSVCGHTVKDGA